MITFIDYKMFESKSTLDNSNYIVSCNEGTFYLYNGLRSLYKLSKNINISFKDLCNAMLNDGQASFIYIEDNSNVNITRLK